MEPQVYVNVSNLICFLVTFPTVAYYEYIHISNSFQSSDIIEPAWSGFCHGRCLPELRQGIQQVLQGWKGSCQQKVINSSNSRVYFK